MTNNVVINSQIINLGGVDRDIIPFDQLAKVETGNIQDNIPPLNKFQYSCLLLNNLGYNKCVSDTSWLDKKVPIENIIKDVPLDYPITKNQLMLNNTNGTNLWDLLCVIRIWGRGPMEQGIILDAENSFILPSQNEIKFNLENGILIKRSAATLASPTWWSTSDVITRRLHNICPHINKTYFHNCIRKFPEYAKQIIVKKPFVVFAAAMVDPNIVMSMIRNSELMAAQKINKLYDGYTALRPDYEMAVEFGKQLETKIEHLSNIYHKYGAQGFLTMIRTEAKPISTMLTSNNEAPVTPTISDEDDFSHLSIEEKRASVNDIQIDGAAKNEIFTYVDRKSFPDYLVESALVRDERGNTVKKYDERFYPTLKRIHRILTQLGIYYPEMLNAKEKWIVSKPFYKNADAFGLYNRAEGVFLLAFPDMEIKILSPKEAVEAYKDKYGDKVLLDPEELGDIMEAPECKTEVIPAGENDDITIVDPSQMASNHQAVDRPKKVYALDDSIDKFLSKRAPELSLIEYN